MESTAGAVARITLIVATKGRLVELEKLLYSLREQTYKGFRVLVADQNPPGYLDSILNRHADALSLERIMTPQGVSPARNACLKRPLGEIIGFPDDDCWYEPDTLEKVVGCFDRLGCQGIVGVSPAWVKAKADERPRILNRFGLLRRTPTWSFFVSAEAVRRTGSFDISLGPGPQSRFLCGEDSDYLLRMHAAGLSIQRCPEVRVNHPDLDFSSPGLASKAYSYGRGRVYLLQKHRYGSLVKVIHLLHPLLYVLAPGSHDKRKYYAAMLKGRCSQLLDQ